MKTTFDDTLLSQIILEFGPESPSHAATVKELQRVEELLMSNPASITGFIAVWKCLERYTITKELLQQTLTMLSAFYLAVGYEYARRETEVSQLESMFKES